MSRHNDRTLFSKIIEVINGSSVNRLINNYDADYRTQHFDTLSHINSMAFMQISDAISLREGIEKLNNSSKLKRIINVPSVSQMSRKNASRDYRLFEEIFKMVVTKAKKKLQCKEYNELFKQIKIIDSTIVQKALALAPQLKYANQKAAIRMSTLYDLSKGIPDKINIVGAKTGERNCIEGFTDEKDALYLFDRGYYSYKWYDELTNEGKKFITRQLSYTKVEVINDISQAESNIIDLRVRIGSQSYKAKNNYREISFKNEQGEEIVLLTNIFELPAEQIIEMYKLRWRIEDFFKWIKQHLRIKEWFGHNENAMKIQLYMGLIVYVLLAMLEQDLKLEINMLKMLRIIQVNLLEECDVMEILSG